MGREFTAFEELVQMRRLSHLEIAQYCCSGQPNQMNTSIQKPESTDSTKALYQPKGGMKLGSVEAGPCGLIDEYSRYLVIRLCRITGA
jgi:hypothetical protein